MCCCAHPHSQTQLYHPRPIGSAPGLNAQCANKSMTKMLVPPSWYASEYVSNQLPKLQWAASHHPLV